MENNKTFEIVVAFEAHNTYIVEADSEEEAQEIVLSGEAFKLKDRYEHSFDVIESREV